MSKVITITATKRERAGKGAARAARREGLVPSVIYGAKKEPAMINIDPRAITKEYWAGHFGTRLWEIDVEGKKERVLPRDLQKHPITDFIEHVDFLRVSAKTVVNVNVPVSFTNEEECPGLKKGGVLNVVRYEIEVACRADSIPESIEVDMGGFELGDSVHISHVKLPEGAKPTIDDRDFTIATITVPSSVKSAMQEEAGEEVTEESDSE